MKLRFAILVIVLALVGSGIFYWYHKVKPAGMATNSQTPPATQGGGTDEYSYMPVPDISMRINGTHEPAIGRGTPLLVRLTAANHGAVNADLINRARAQRQAALQEKLAKGEVRQDEVAAVSGREISIKTVELGGENARWEKFVHFLQRMPDGKDVPITWPLQRIGADPAAKMVLDAQTTVQLNFALAPEAASAIAPGEYTIVGILEVPPDAQLPAGQWRGRVETEPVTLEIKAQEAQVSPAEKTKRELEYVNYFLAENQAAQALQHAQEAIAASPSSIDAQIAVGDSKNMQNDLQGALDAYQSALTAFHNQPDLPYEPPSLLTYKISMLQEKLARKP